MVIVYVPGESPFLVTTVRADVAEPPDGTLTGLVLKLHVLFFGGQPVRPRETIPLKVSTDAKVSLYVALWPRAMLTEVGLEEIEKSGTSTVSDTDVVWVRVPSVPWMFIVYVPRGVLLPVCTVRVEGL